MDARVRRLRWVLFAVFFFTVPLPLLGPFDGFIPAVRHGIVAGAALAVAAFEGAEGPVRGAVGLFVAHAVVWTIVAFVASRVLARVLAPRLAGRGAGWFWAALVLWLLASVVFDLYATPFGRFQRVNLLGVFS